MSLRVNMRTADVTLALSGRTARELLTALGTIGRRITEETLETWLEDLRRQGLAEQADGRWSLTDTAMRAFGRGLSLQESSRDRPEIREASE